MEGAESGRKKYRLISVLHKVQEAKALVLRPADYYFTRQLYFILNFISILPYHRQQYKDNN